MSATMSHASDTILYVAAPSTTQATCTWLGHCLGDSCASYDDCDNDWVCSNQICVPCCETGVPNSLVLTTPMATSATVRLSTASSVSTQTFTPTSSPTPSPTSSPTPAPQHGLTKANIITISVAGAVGAVVIALLIFFIWRWRRKRRSRQHPWHNPAHTFGKAELDSMSPAAATGATKYRHELEADEPPVEMPGSMYPLDPDSIELIELEGDTAYAGKGYNSMAPPPLNEVYKPPIDNGHHGKPLHRLSPRAGRFQEVVSPESARLGHFRASPVSDVSSTHLIHSPPQPYRRLDGHDIDEPIFDEHRGSDSSYTLFSWPTQESPQRRDYG